MRIINQTLIFAFFYPLPLPFPLTPAFSPPPLLLVSLDLANHCVLGRLPISVIKFFVKSNIRENGLIWLRVLGYSPVYHVKGVLAERP